MGQEHSVTQQTIDTRDYRCADSLFYGINVPMHTLEWKGRNVHMVLMLLNTKCATAWQQFCSYLWNNNTLFMLIKCNYFMQRMWVWIKLSLHITIAFAVVWELCLHRDSTVRRFNCSYLMLIAVSFRLPSQLQLLYRINTLFVLFWCVIQCWWNKFVTVMFCSLVLREKPT